jgi:glucuronokinase
MDRVIQVWGGLVSMDLRRHAMHDVDGYRCGRYESLDSDLLPDLYLAYGHHMAEPTEVVHGDLARRYAAGDAHVLDTMAELASLVDAAIGALRTGDAHRFGALMDRNFELRRSVSHVADGHALMVERARAAGAPAKFAGSGGAIVGVLPDAETLARLRWEMKEIGCEVLVPTVPGKPRR